MKLSKLFIIFFLVVCTPLMSEEWGPMSGKMPDINASGPKHSSKYYVTEGRVKNGKISFNIPVQSSTNIQMMLTGMEATKVMMDGSHQLSHKRYNTPDLESMDIPGFGSRIQISQAVPGYHTIDIEGTSLKKNIQLIVAEPESNLEMHMVVSPLAAKTGDTVSVSADFGRMSDISTAKITCFMGDGQSFMLKNNGDGLFKGTFTAESDRGFTEMPLRLEGEGSFKDGTPFRRTSGASVMITRPESRLSGVISEENAVIRVPLSAETGHFRIDVVYGSGEYAQAYSRKTINSSELSDIIKINIPDVAKSADSAVVRILNLNTLGMEGEYKVSLTPEQVKGPLNVIKKPMSLPQSKIAGASLAAEQGQHHHYH